MQRQLRAGQRQHVGSQLRANRAAVPTRGARSVRALRINAGTSPVQGQKFDYIIVGGGTAGCVLANRLTADGSKSVLLIEAGVAKKRSEVTVPAGLTKLFNHAVFDWGLYSAVQPQLDTREIYLARGKLLGGSSCTNATLYHRGTAEDYDSWKLDGWSSKDVLPWFISAEDNASGKSDYHGVGGAMHVESPRYQNKLFDEFFAAAKAAGIPQNPDFNDWSRPQTGFGEFQVTQDRGERADMARQYLQPALKRGNLKVLTSAVTTKIQFERAAGQQRARGVEFAVGGAGGERFTAEVNPTGEVLLAAGAIHSPNLLQLSGVGASRTLRDLGIPVVADLPGVGQNLQDHPAILTAFRAKEEYKGISVTSEIYNDQARMRKRAILNYLLRRRGPLATTGCDRGAFVSTTGEGQPDLQIRFVAGMSLQPDGLKTYRLFAEYQAAGTRWPDGVTFQLLGCRPKSRGYVGLKSTSPFAQPDININYFTDPEGADMATLVAGIKLSRAIAAQGPLAQYLESELHPGVDAADDEALRAYIRDSVHSGNAIVGTCRMGASPADNDVVSPKDLTVHGVAGLRVVDASVLPAIIGGQTGAPVVMVAERAAAMLTAAQPTLNAVPSPPLGQPIPA